MSLNLNLFTDVNEQNLTAISNQIRHLNTNVLMIGWCYANNGDLAMALRSDATLSRLILEQEMRDIGILNPRISDQQKEVLEEAYKKKDVFLYGNTGAGKTVIGAEVVKIKMAQWIRNSVRGTVLILTYKEAFSNLNKYFKNTLFKNMSRCRGIKIEFKNFADAFQISSDDLYSTKVIKAKIHDYCKNVTGKQIIMVDEFETNHFTEDADYDYDFGIDVNELDFSDFSEHDNVDFIICVSPIGRRTGSQGRSRPINYNLDQHKSQYIKWLEGRYRNTKKILEFTKMLQSFILSDTGRLASSLSMANDKDISNLPSPFPSHDPPVIWIDFDASKPKSLQTVLKKLQNLISSSESGSQVPVLVPDVFYNNKPEEVTEFKKSLITMINSDNRRIIQPYTYQEFIGMEADIVIVPLLAFGSSLNFNNTMLQCCSRARRMLIIITSYEHPVMDFMWNKSCILSKAFHSGEELVQKIHVNGSNERITIGDKGEKLDINFSWRIVEDNLERGRRRRKNLPKSYYNYYCRECSFIEEHPSSGELVKKEQCKKQQEYAN